MRTEVTSRTDAEEGFKPIGRRGVVERANGWVKRARRNAPDYEHTASSGEAAVRVARMKIRPNRLTDEKPEFPARGPKITKKSSWTGSHYGMDFRPAFWDCS